jgi:hypothetical protein
MEVIMDKAQDVVKAFTRIPDDFANLELGKAALERLEAWEGLEMIVAIGRDEGARDRPIRVEAIINDVEALGLVAEVGLAPCGRSRGGQGRCTWGGGVDAG